MKKSIIDDSIQWVFEEIYDTEEHMLETSNGKQLDDIFRQECIIPNNYGRKHRYSTNWNNIRPYLETFTYRVEYNASCPSPYLVRLSADGFIHGSPKDVLGYAKTLPRAACMAIILYYRLKVRKYYNPDKINLNTPQKNETDKIYHY